MVLYIIDYQIAFLILDLELGRSWKNSNTVVSGLGRSSRYLWT